MSSHERAPARVQGPDLHHQPDPDGKDDDPSVEWDDLVAGIDEQLIEVSDEITDRALAPEADGDTAITSAVPELAEEGSGAQMSARSRGRRATVVSPIPAMLAQSMGRIPEPPAPAVPVAITASHTEITRPVVEAGAPAKAARSQGSSSYEIELTDTPLSPERRRASELIEQARACFTQGNLPGAVLAADELLAGTENRTSPVADLVETARPLFDQIFASYVGLLGEVPVMARSDEEVAALGLDERTRALLSRVDGVQTLEQLFSISKIPAVEAVRIAASLMSAGVIRVV